MENSSGVKSSVCIYHAASDLNRNKQVAEINGKQSQSDSIQLMFRVEVNCQVGQHYDQPSSATLHCCWRKHTRHGGGAGTKLVISARNIFPNT
jgi:hypothetical protein